MPDVAGAPEAVADLRAKAEREAEKREAADKKEREEEAKPLPPDESTLYMPVPKLGVNGHTFKNDTSAWALDQETVKTPETGFPWQDNANPYIAGHRIGYAGTESYYQFFDLPSMQKGDEVILEVPNGREYRYAVSEMLTVTPQNTWVTAPIAGRDIVTLQTCTETVDDWWTTGPGLVASGPDSGCLIVRAAQMG